MRDVVDLTVFPDGRRYEDEYGGWLETFRRVAEASEVEVVGAPRSWSPLLRYLGAAVGPDRLLFPSCAWLHPAAVAEAEASGELRALVEGTAGWRPEVVDALWKSDCEWATVGRRHSTRTQFVVASSGSFYRPEVVDYLRRLGEYRKPETAQICVVTNCAADKPYPAPLHSAIDERLTPQCHLVIATGVLGVVPRELWGQMPMYDSGLPNLRRCEDEWTAFLGRNRYEALVLYTDFYAECVMRAALRVDRPPRIFTPLGTVHQGTSPAGGGWVFQGYMDLMSPVHLDELSHAVRTAIRACIPGRG